MGLDDFKTSSSSTSGNSSESSSGQRAKATPDEDPMDEYPHFSVVEKKYEGDIRVLRGSEAFPKSARHSDEIVRVSVDTKQEFNRINDQVQKLTGEELETLFLQDPIKGKDLVDRLVENDEMPDEVTCPVCSNTLVLEEEPFTKVYGEYVHSRHSIRDVNDKLKEEE